MEYFRRSHSIAGLGFAVVGIIIYLSAVLASAISVEGQNPGVVDGYVIVMIIGVVLAVTGPLTCWVILPIVRNIGREE
ncbi:MAG: hypothetical protein IH860_03275 [Chloroflexi bacterium]|nr:hypothetical protein [Chloroflexota bacterium]